MGSSSVQLAANVMVKGPTSTWQMPLSYTYCRRRRLFRSCCSFLPVRRTSRRRDQEKRESCSLVTSPGHEHPTKSKVHSFRTSLWCPNESKYVSQICRLWRLLPSCQANSSLPRTANSEAFAVPEPNNHLSHYEDFIIMGTRSLWTTSATNGSILIFGPFRGAFARRRRR